jgi:putative ABC transport system permease protein
VIGEIAISLVLLTGAALMVKSLLHLQRVEPGFQPESVLTFDVALPASTYAGSEQVGAFYTSLIERARLLPGVSAAAATAVLPFSGADQSCGFFIEGRPVTSPDETPDAHHRAITPGYFAAMRIPVVAGRAFTDEDSARSRRVAIVNETMARQFWRVQKPLGARLALNIEVWRYYQDRAPELDIAGGMREIVGIVADVRHSSLDAQAVPEVYVPHAQLAPRRMSVLVRTAGSPALLAEALRGEVRALDRNQAISNVRAMTDLLAASLAGPRLSTRLVAAFSGVAVALAVVGLYGILAFTVTQRRQEIGVRIALGATRTDVLGLIFRQGVVLIAVGLVIGTAAAAAVTRLLRGLLFEVSPTDPGTFVLTALLLTAVGLVACYLPARRAAALDPIEALRYD